MDTANNTERVLTKREEICENLGLKLSQLYYFRSRYPEKYKEVKALVEAKREAEYQIKIAHRKRELEQLQKLYKENEQDV